MKLIIEALTMPCIGGCWSYQDDGKDVRSMLDRLLRSQIHRDPEAQPRTFHAPGLALGMRNQHLGIWGSPDDLPLGYQGVQALVDGIVLDWPELRGVLEGKGVRLENPSCAQIIAAAYHVWGLEFMEHLEGEFSCAVWDPRERQLLLARDPLGAKCIHYCDHPELLIFSSEIKGILAAGVVAEVDWQSLSDFLSMNGVPAPSTFFRGIRQVRPGCLLVARPGRVEERQYWSPLVPTRAEITEGQACEELHDKLLAAIKRRCIGEQIYCFLSGGMDSSAVVALATKASGRRVHSISIGFEESAFNELPDARAMAKHVNTIHHEMVCRPRHFLEMLETLIWHHDFPFHDTSACPTYYAARLASQHTSMILTGDGPDQLLGSGNHVHAVKSGLFSRNRFLYRAAARIVASQLKRAMPRFGDPRPVLPWKVYRKLSRDGRSPVWAYYDLKASFPEFVKEYLCTPELLRYHRQASPFRLPERWFAEAESLGSLGQMLYADVMFYVPDDLMIKVDRMSRAHGLETLMPFYDRTVARFLLSLPSPLRLLSTRSGEVKTKYVLRRLSERLLPSRLLSKPKQGFGMPLDDWLRKDDGRFLREVLLDHRSLTRGYFEVQPLRTFVEDFLARRCDFAYANAPALVMLLNLELWHRLYIDRRLPEVAPHARTPEVARAD